MRGRRTTVLVAGAVEHTPTRTTAVLVIVAVVERDPRQLELFAAPPARVIEAELAPIARAA